MLADREAAREALSSSARHAQVEAGIDWSLLAGLEGGDPVAEGGGGKGAREEVALPAIDAEIIGIIDADYVVTPDWLKDLVPAFDDPRVGLVQAPQEHRDGDRSLMHYIMNGEYDPGTGIREGEELAARIKGSKFIPLMGLGHFPMTENFPAMKPALMQALDEIASRP